MIYTLMNFISTNLFVLPPLFRSKYRETILYLLSDKKMLRKIKDLICIFPKVCYTLSVGKDEPIA